MRRHRKLAQCDSSPQGAQGRSCTQQGLEARPHLYSGDNRLPLQGPPHCTYLRSCVVADARGFSSSQPDEDPTRPIKFLIVVTLMRSHVSVTYLKKERKRRRRKTIVAKHGYTPPWARRYVHVVSAHMSSWKVDYGTYQKTYLKRFTTSWSQGQQNPPVRLRVGPLMDRFGAEMYHAAFWWTRNGPIEANRNWIEKLVRSWGQSL